MGPRTRRERFILRERRHCRKYGFCHGCMSPRLLPLMRLLQDLVGSQTVRECLEWARGEGEKSEPCTHAETCCKGPGVCLHSCPEVAADPVQSASPSPDRPGTGY